MTPEEMVSRLLYRDGLMLIIDKPAGVAVHKGPKGGPCLEDHFPRCSSACRGRPRWRTGSTARPPAAWCWAATARRWPSSADLFRHGKVGKTYWARGRGRPGGATEGRIDLALGKLDDNRGWWMKPDPKGLPSATTWKVMGRGDRPAPGSRWSR